MHQRENFSLSSWDHLMLRSTNPYHSSIISRIDWLPSVSLVMICKTDQTLKSDWCDFAPMTLKLILMKLFSSHCLTSFSPWRPHEASASHRWPDVLALFIQFNPKGEKHPPGHVQTLHTPLKQRTKVFTFKPTDSLSFSQWLKANRCLYLQAGECDLYKHRHLTQEQTADVIKIHFFFIGTLKGFRQSSCPLHTRLECCDVTRKPKKNVAQVFGQTNTSWPPTLCSAFTPLSVWACHYSCHRPTRTQLQASSSIPVV